MDENRRSLRHAVVGLAYFRNGHGTFSRGHLVDVSESGIGLVTDRPLSSMPEQVAFRLEGMAPVLFQVKPVWNTLDGEQHRIGLELLAPTGASCDKKCLDRWLNTRPAAPRRARGRRRKAS